MPGQYIYAYQIFNRFGDYEAVGRFAIFGIDEYTLDVYEDSIDSQDGEDDGIEPISAYFTPSHSKGVWKFEDKEGFSVIGAGERSYFLVFSSDSAPVRGNFEVEPPTWVPVTGEVPEPAMITLFGIGSALMMLTRRRRSL